MRYVSGARMEWIEDRLADPFSGVTAIVPRGYDAYVRLPQRAYLVLRGDVGSSGAADPRLETWLIAPDAAAVITRDALNH